MSNSISPPWLLSLALDCLTAPTPAPSSAEKRQFSSVRTPQAVVQVLQVSVALRAALISDQQHFIWTFFTPPCLQALRLKNVSLADMQHCLVCLDQFHLSTVVQAGADRDEMLLRSSGLSAPFALLCESISWIGHDALQVMGSPSDINRNGQLRNLLQGLSYFDLVQRLVQRQFPQYSSLPASDGVHYELPSFDEEHPLTLDQCRIPAQQEKLLELMSDYTKSTALKVQHAKEQILSETQPQVGTETLQEAWDETLREDEPEEENMYTIENIFTLNNEYTAVSSQPVATPSSQQQAPEDHHSTGGCEMILDVLLEETERELSSAEETLPKTQRSSTLIESHERMEEDISSDADRTPPQQKKSSIPARGAVLRQSPTSPDAAPPPAALIGRAVRKELFEKKWIGGEIVGYERPMYIVEYRNGRQKRLFRKDVDQILLPGKSAVGHTSTLPTPAPAPATVASSPKASAQSNAVTAARVAPEALRVQHLREEEMRALSTSTTAASPSTQRKKRKIESVCGSVDSRPKQELQSMNFPLLSMTQKRKREQKKWIDMVMELLLAKVNRTRSSVGEEETGAS